MANTQIIPKKWRTLTVVAVIIIAFFMLGPFYIVDQGEQAVLTRFGTIVNTRTDAGLYIKVPVLDIVTIYPKRILSLDGDMEPTQTKENLRVIVDTTTRWRISDPVKFYKALTTLGAANVRLSDIIDSSVRKIIASNSLTEIVRSSNIIMLSNRENAEDAVSESPDGSSSSSSIEDGTENETEQTQSAVSELTGDINAAAIAQEVLKGRRELSNEMANEARKIVPDFGIELIDVVPRQIKYADELTESVYNRMIKERNQVAQRNRSRGEGNKADWMGRLESDLLKIQSDAYRQSEEMKGRADAEASAIYANAYRKAPEFYTFWKSMESYRLTMPKFDATYSTNMDYFNYLYSPSGTRR